MKQNLQSAPIKNDGHVVRLTKPNMVDAGVILGYAAPRGNGALLVIGRGARLRSGTVIYGGSRIGRDLETGHNVIIREENKIGDKLRIWSNSIIDYGCRIGDNVKIHSGVYICQFTTIEDDVFIAPGVIFANDIHPGCPDASRCMQGPQIKRGAQIGVNSTVLPRMIIGENAVIGAGSVVTRDIPPGVVAYGNPARAIRRVEDLVCTIGLRDKPYENLFGRMTE